MRLGWGIGFPIDQYNHVSEVKTALLRTLYLIKGLWDKFKYINTRRIYLCLCDDDVKREVWKI